MACTDLPMTGGQITQQCPLGVGSKLSLPFMLTCIILATRHYDAGRCWLRLV